jgi:hypothetical protein
MLDIVYSPFNIYGRKMLMRTRSTMIIEKNSRPSSASSPSPPKNNRSAPIDPATNQDLSDQRAVNNNRFQRMASGGGTLRRSVSKIEEYATMKNLSPEEKQKLLEAARELAVS